MVSEKRLTEIRWKKRETNIDRIDRSASQMYGELQGVAPELADIKSLPEEINEETDE